MLERKDVRIRDPFVVPDPRNGCYYLYGTTALDPGSIAARHTFSAYRTQDLEHFEGPFLVFDGAACGFWADRDYWAPEVHFYNGKYYMFASFKAEDHVRATQILVSDEPLGTFRPLTDRPATPEDWECLDGTLYVDGETPYLVFSHEWLQVHDGEVCAQKLTPDLCRPVGEPFVLFRASENPDVRPIGKKDGLDCYVTDGPFFVPCEKGVTMLWSSFNERGYAIYEATAESIHGKWTHHPPKYDFDGGHSMIFTDLAGRRRISLHAPNTSGAERAHFLPVD